MDVVIIGGGPAGSAMGAYLAKAGISCMILEKEQFPRPHVGEALVVACNRVFKEIGVLDKLTDGEFIYKYGAAWTSEASNKPFSHGWEDFNDDIDVSVDFSKQDGTFYTTTSLHVDRAKFDKLLLDHAESLGAKVIYQANVHNISHSENGCEVHYREGKVDKEVKCKLIVDASGRRTLVGRMKGWKQIDDVFDQCAVHTWVKGADIPEMEKHYTYIHFLPEMNSWLWQIQITDEITSLGVVSQKSTFQAHKLDYNTFFWEMISKRDDLSAKLKSAERIRDFKVEGDYSYSMSQICDDGVVMIGDAARFVDPIFSSGVSVALNSARYASKSIIEAIRTESYSRAAFKSYENTMEIGTNNWYRFISLYYRLNVLFTYFVSRKEYRKDVLKFLQGDVYDNSGEHLLEAMEQLVKDVENNPKHPLHDHLSELSSEAFQVDYFN